MAQVFGVGVDVDGELAEDGEPDVFGSDLQVVMEVVGSDGAVDEAVSGRLDEDVVVAGGLENVVGEGRL